MRYILIGALLLAGASLSGCPAEQASKVANDPRVRDLADLSVAALRARDYGSAIEIIYQVSGRSSPSYMAAYRSGGLKVYARIDLPAFPPPEAGYPVVILVHGWVGIEGAPALDFYYDASSNYGQIIDAYVAAGFAVLVPGWRGHGTVNGIPADGIEFLRAWDNGSYISPVFYAIDVLNLLDGIGSFAPAKLNQQRINLFGHSQGGDVALIVLAAAGEGSRVKHEVHAATIWSGTFASRFTQLETFWPMQTSAEAFLSGDGSWNGTAIGAGGEVNPHFVYGYPPDWIGTPDPTQWNWQNENWSLPTVADALVAKLDQLYAAVNEFVVDRPDASYRIETHDDRKTTVTHEDWVIEGLNQIGAFDHEPYLTENLALHHSDRDFYSLPDWNADLCTRVNKAGGQCFNFSYPGNTHALRLSKHQWFSTDGSIAGFSFAIQRDIALFHGGDPADIAFP